MVDAGAAGIPQRLGYVPSLDGLRAVAVSAVFLFHAGVLSGGFIGVDVFFVISGFLITSLAVSEIESSGRLALGAFWARRARRLLPALLLVMAAVVVYSVAEGGAALRRVGGDVLATTFYVANWAQIGEGRDYFAQYESEPLLEHAWSLSVEEQFYVVWPLMLVGLVALAGRFGFSIRRGVLVLAAAAALVSLLIAFWLKSFDDVSLTRMYYGTDTRMVGLAVGAALGAGLLPSRLPSRTRPRLVGGLAGGVAGDIAGVCALAALAVLSILVDGGERWLYGAGFLVIALLSAVMLTVAVGDGHLATALSAGPLVALGRVSYGVYLWQWPVIVVLSTERTGLEGLPLGVLWVAATAVLTTFSWYVVERRAPLPSWHQPVRVIGYLAATVAVCAGAVIVANAAIDEERTAAYSVPQAPADRTSDVSATAVAASPVPTSGVTPTTIPDGTGPQPTDRASTTSTAPATTIAAPVTLPLPVDRPLRLMIVGDSVALSLRDGPDPLPEQEVFDVPSFGAVEILNVGAIGCPVIEDGIWLLNDGTTITADDSCASAGRFAEEIERYDPDVVFTLFGWPGVNARIEFDDGTALGPCTERFDDEWREDYQRLVDRLSVGRPTVVSNVAPVFGLSDELHEGTRCLNSLVDQLDATVFDNQDWLCPDYDCTISESLRPDGVHFRSAGQLQRDVTAQLVEQVLPLAGFVP